MLSVVNQRMENFDARAKAETEATLSVIADAMTAEGIDNTVTTQLSETDMAVKSRTDGKEDEDPSTVVTDGESSKQESLSEVTELHVREPNVIATIESKQNEIANFEEDR